MKQRTLPAAGITTIQVDRVSGDLQIVGWDRPEITAKTDDNNLALDVDGVVVHASCRSDLILYTPREVSLQIGSVGGDADVRAILGGLTIDKVSGDLQIRNIGSVEVNAVGGDMSLRGCAGALAVNKVGGDASLHEIKSDVVVNVGADLYLRDAGGSVQATVGSDAALYLTPAAGKDVNVKAGSDILLRLSPKADVELTLVGSDEESVRIDLPGVDPGETGTPRTLVVGKGGARVNLVAGSDVIVTSRGDEWNTMTEFDPLGHDGPFSPGEFPGLSHELHERISRQVEDATRRALEASMRAQEQSDRVQRRVDAAMRRAEEKMRTSERRSMHMGIKVGSLGGTFDIPPFPPVPPIPPIPPIPPMPPLTPNQPRAAAAEPVSDQERLVILQMLQNKKISVQEAEKLLASLEGK